MQDLSEKYIYDHQNPVKKIDLPSTKEFLSIAKQEDSKKYLSNFKIALEHNRVDRRCARTKAVWLPDQQAAKIIKTVGSLQHYGYQNKYGKFLYPEEILYLLEINKLEVVYNDVPLSIQESFEILLKHNLTLQKYLIYKKLTLQGYRLLKKLKSEADNDEKTAEPCNKTRKITDNNNGDEKTTEPCNKMRKITNNNGDMEEIFMKLRQKAPRNFNENHTQSTSPDYYVYLPKSTNNRPDFSLFIVEKSEPTDFISCNSTDETSKIFALFSKDGEFTGFYRCGIVNIPCL